MNCFLFFFFYGGNCSIIIMGCNVAIRNCHENLYLLIRKCSATSSNFRFKYKQYYRSQQDTFFTHRLFQLSLPAACERVQETDDLIIYYYDGCYTNRFVFDSVDGQKLNARHLTIIT